MREMITLYVHAPPHGDPDKQAMRVRASAPPSVGDTIKYDGARYVVRSVEWPVEVSDGGYIARGPVVTIEPPPVDDEGDLDLYQRAHARASSSLTALGINPRDLAPATAAALRAGILAAVREANAPALEAADFLLQRSDEYGQTLRHSDGSGEVWRASFSAATNALLAAAHELGCGCAERSVSKHVAEWADNRRAARKVGL